MHLRRFGIGLLCLGAAAAGAFWIVTAPQPLAAGDLPAHHADLANGERMFHAGGCASCHASEGGLGGGLELATPFGLFRVPNISSDPEHGIGAWTGLQFANAMLRGIAPSGAHYYPAFPYGSYTRMRVEDVLDLRAYLLTLPAVARPSEGHDLPFPFSVRRGIGLWKWLYLSSEPVVAFDGADEQVLRGRYLVEGPGHCGECHTPRSALGGLDLSRWLAGAPAPSGEGMVPNITPHENGLAGWTADDIAYALETGFTPDFDSLGGEMADVQQNLAQLPADDRAAMAAYLKAIPALP